jgi:GAF domain-containing protein
MTVPVSAVDTKTTNAKPSYQELETRVKELEKLLGGIISNASDDHELFELAILSNISEALASTMDLNELLAIVIDEVNKALLAEGAGVLLYDENRGDLYWKQIRDARHILAPQSEELRLPLEHSIAGWVFKNNKPARVNDTARDPRYYPEMTRKSGFEIKKVLQVPLTAKDKTIGVLMVMNKIGGDFTEQDEALAMSMAGSIALAIDNATVYAKLKKTRDDLEMIYRSSMALAQTMDLDHLLTVVIDEMRTALDTEAGGVLLYDEKRGDLYWREAQDAGGFLKVTSSDLRLPLDSSISGRVFQTGEPALLNDPESDPLFFKPFEKRSGFEIRNEIIVPLHTRERTIGVLVIMNKRQGRFTEDDLHLLLSLAGVVALAVENANFFEELLASYQDLENLNRAKSKVLNHLSHELRTPLAIIRGTLATMERKLKEMGVNEFERPFDRMNRNILSLNRLETQVESILMTGYSWERRMITDFLQKALDLMEVQTEWTPEIKRAAEMIHKWLEKTFPTRHDELEEIEIKDFGQKIAEHVSRKVTDQQRYLSISFDLDDCRLLIPQNVLYAVMEGLIRNAIEATPDCGSVSIVGRSKGDRYILRVKDTGIGIPDEDKELIFQGFYPVQDIDNYSSGRQYSFNAGGKGIDLLRIRMFSELYGFRLSFTTKRCALLKNAGQTKLSVEEICRQCCNTDACHNNSGSEFVVDFPTSECLRSKQVCE